MTLDGRSSDGDLMVKVARLYHDEGIRQSEIAERLNLSQASVSRMLARAKDAGVVRTIVVSPPGAYGEIESAVRDAYGLVDAVVVDDAPPGIDASVDLGTRSAGYLQATLSSTAVLGVSSWSATLLAAASAMSPRLSGSRRTSGQVVQLVGGHGDPRVQARAARLLTLLAQALGARPVALSAPATLATADARDALLGDPALAPVVSLWSQADAALVGIGSVDPSPLLRESGNAGNAQDQAELAGLGAVGDICLRYIDADGRPVVSGVDQRIVGVDLETFRRIPRRIAVAGGAAKAPAIRAALADGWINVLVTDASTAQALTA